MADVIMGGPALQARLRALGLNTGPQLINVLGLTTVAEAKRLVPRKTSNLGRSIHIASRSNSQVIVAAGAKYARFVEYPTRPHIIRAKNAKALFFASQGITTARFGSGAKLNFALTGRLSAASVRKYGNGAFVLAKEVHHPGTRAQPFLRPGAQRAIEIIDLPGLVATVWNAA